MRKIAIVIKFFLTKFHTQTNREFVFPNSWESSWTGKVMALCKRPTLILVVVVLEVLVVVVDEVALGVDITMFAEMLGKAVEAEEEVLLSADSKL